MSNIGKCCTLKRGKTRKGKNKKKEQQRKINTGDL
jgi:hypothetical protein